MKRLVHLASLAFACCTVLIGAAAHATDSVETRLVQTLKTRFPAVKVDTVQPSPIPGLYEVISGDHVVYADATGDHVIVGNMMDTRTKENLSQAAVDSLYSIDFKSLPLDEAIKIVRGSGEHKVALFEDPDCPYCRQLEQGMAAMSDVTIYLFLFPIKELHPQAPAHAEAIWCSPDRAATWTNWMVYRTPIPGGGSCAGDPIAKINALAQSLHITATPTIFLQSGKRIGGAIPASQLERMIAKASGGPARLAASKAAPN